MKILVCTDGSGQSQRVIEKAAQIAAGGNVEVTVIHVYETSKNGPYRIEGNETLSEELNRQLIELKEQEKEKSKKVLSDAAKALEKKNINAKTLLKEGRAAETIVRVAAENEFDIVVLGSRGLSGLKKMFLGSVSNAVLHEIKASVLIVK
ncbi:universal stress protein [Dethiobacter alkaliphilus]|uniref:universal stress protein n=1 Tax=Dethiobacter alkaliphilus TaxID=427926 RepID=UPI00222613BF|nr:universal stress protein [Dethiobacter alkaliphilus]MCW3489737.1 universal stress protein [Dethiobacter alkaliphilus]